MAGLDMCCAALSMGSKDLWRKRNLRRSYLAASKTSWQQRRRKTQHPSKSSPAAYQAAPGSRNINNGLAAGISDRRVIAGQKAAFAAALANGMDFQRCTNQRFSLIWLAVPRPRRRRIRRWAATLWCL